MPFRRLLQFRKGSFGSSFVERHVGHGSALSICAFQFHPIAANEFYPKSHWALVRIGNSDGINLGMLVDAALQSACHRSMGDRATPEESRLRQGDFLAKLEEKTGKEV